MLVWMAVALLPAFGLTAAVTQAYKAEQRHLAAEWFARGERALEDDKPAEAIVAFRTALTFSGEDRAFRLRLAQALAEDGRPTEARAYLLTLRDAQPGSGPVNLALARLAAGSGNKTEAYRYYHAAIEGAWTDSAEVQRRAIRVELARYLVQSGDRLQAQAELVVLEGDLPPHPDEQRSVAALMLEAGLASRAQRIYERLLPEDNRNAASLAGAGRAAFEQGDYRTAESFLSKAEAAGATGEPVASTLALARSIVALDPYQRGLTMRARLARAREALDIASTRLHGCAPDRSDPRFPQLGEELAKLQGLLAPANRDPDLLDTAMEIVFRVEQITAAECGEPQGPDRALLLIARARTGGAP
ncbi:MAG TPA: tetratricopeptide repeat protein [Vicinamibacterales bacterium]|nr:tetratricopeptide repeat protein [Vicinamibacterales bacterium]